MPTSSRRTTSLRLPKNPKRNKKESQVPKHLGFFLCIITKYALQLLCFFSGGSLFLNDVFLDGLSSSLFLCSSSGSLLCLSSSLDSSLFLSSSLQLSSILGNDLHRNLNSNLLVEVNQSNEVADSLGILHGDDLAVDVVTELLQLLSNLVGTY